MEAYRACSTSHYESCCRLRSTACVLLSEWKLTELALRVMKDRVMEIPWRSKTNILGSCVDDTGDTNVMVHAQIQKATGAFYRDAELLLCRDIPFSKKVSHYLKHVLPVALHGCGAWICKQGTLMLLHGFETRMLKLMYGYKKNKGMDWVTWHRVATNKAK